MKPVLRWWLLGVGALSLLLLPACRTVGIKGRSTRLGWTNNLLLIQDARLPGGTLEVFYLEAFCLPGGHQRPWGQTRIPHQTSLLKSPADASELRFRSTVGPEIEVLHEVRPGTGDTLVEMDFEIRNHGSNAWPVLWFQPACVRVDRFTGAGQSNYTARSFVFTRSGRTTLDAVRRTTNALYLGGQVYLPEGIREEDANPRPVALDRVTNGIIGAVSGDGKQVLAIASDRTFELFEGVYVCLHSDPWIGGLNPRESRQIRQRIYLLPNDTDRLLRRSAKAGVGRAP
jgi:hypothetical protein